MASAAGCWTSVCGVLWAKIPRYRQLRGRLGRLERPLVKLSPEALHSLATDLIRQHHD